MGALRQDVAALNELFSSLEEESISKLSLEDGNVSFTLHTEAQGVVPITVVFEDAAAYPKSAVLLMSEAELPFLDQLTEKLSASGCKLTKALRLLGAKLDLDLDWVEEADGGGGSNAGSDGEGMDVDRQSDDEDAELLREWSRCLTRWEAVERQHEKEEEEDTSAGNLDALSNKQIFDTKAAFRRLVNEMEEIFKAQDFNLVAEANGPDGLYTWTVSLAGFSHSSPLAQDMQQAGRKFGISSVQLQLRFKRGLHPFYPPAIKLMAPRFQGPMLSALASHPMFTSERWDPFQSAKEFLLNIKTFLEEHGRVELDAECNRMTGPGSSAYLEPEHLLARLEALSGVSSLWRTEGHSLYRAHNSPLERCGDSPRPAIKKQRAEGSEVAGKQGAGGAKVAWAAGTGYGYGHKQGAEVWDAKRAAAVQVARDAELRDLLSRLATALSAQLGEAGGAGDESDVANCVLAVHKSCLAPLLIHNFCTASFQDMAARRGYYTALLECLEAVCNPHTAPMLSWRAGEGEASVAEAVGRVQLQASHFVRVCGTGASSTSTPVSGGRRAAQPAAQSGAGCAGLSSPAAGPPSCGTSPDEEHQEVLLANCLLQVAKKVEGLAKEESRRGQGTSASAAAAVAGGPASGPRTRRQQQEQQAAAASAGPPEAPDADAVYRRELSKHKVRILEGIAATHVFKDSASKESVQPKERLRRVGKELASCESDLPIHPDSSVFVVADEASTCLWKALIIGPKGTPYEGGCFLFDIYFPTDYPRVPPKVQLKTTGAGSVRFNPNLYNCGKVCLSLLGTWQGARGESWDAAVSTILQVLVSIQSLIMVDEPFYNEPGFEQRANSAQSDAYSANIMEQTVRWAMEDQLKSPPSYFRDVITSHFKLRGNAVIATCKRWVAWCKEKGHSRHATAIEKMVGQLEEECRKLNSA